MNIGISQVSNGFIVQITWDDRPDSRPLVKVFTNHHDLLGWLTKTLQPLPPISVGKGQQ